MAYFFLDYRSKSIAKYDANLNYKSSVSINNPQNMISVNNANSTELFITGVRSIIKYDINMNQTAHYYKNFDQFVGLYYNKSGDYILVCSNTTNRIDVFSDLYYRHIKNPNCTRKLRVSH